MSENTTYQPLTLFVVDSPANPIALQENKKPVKTSATYGRSFAALLAKLSRAGSWLKMFGGYFQAKMDGSLVEFSGTWPKAGIVSNGNCYRLHPLVRPIREKGSSSWHIPTPTASDGTMGKAPPRNQIKPDSMHSVGLKDWVKMYPTPTARDWKGKSQRGNHGNTTDCLPNAVGGIPNPEFVEWLMGLPDGWTDLER